MRPMSYADAASARKRSGENRPVGTSLRQGHSAHGFFGGSKDGNLVVRVLFDVVHSRRTHDLPGLFAL